jgi:hypothetical protein
LHDPDPNRIPTVDDGSHPYSPPGARMADPVARKQSGVGVVSLVIGLLGGVGTIAAFGYAGYLAVTDPEAVANQDARVMFVGLAIIGCLLFELLGAALGVAGLLQRDRKRLAAGFGLGINLLLLLGTGALLVMGTVMSP